MSLGKWRGGGVDVEVIGKSGHCAGYGSRGRSGWSGAMIGRTSV